MDCKDIQELLSAYSDRELDLVKSLEIEDHLQECVSCADQLKTYAMLKNVTGTPSLYYSAPSRLRERVRASLREEANSTKVHRMNFRWVSYAACIAVAFLLGWMIQEFRPSPSTEEAFDQEIVSSHLRSLMPDHLTDVASTDQHTVKPWFNGKVDYSPVVHDFADQGFPLIGGRLDYIQLKRVPVLVYARRKHYINVYTWPTSSGEIEPRNRTVQGYHLESWVKAGAAYCVVSDLNTAELGDFVKLLRSQS